MLIRETRSRGKRSRACRCSWVWEWKRELGEVMQIGKPVRTIVVRPLELPVEQLTREVEPDLIESADPAKEPEQVAVTS